MGSINPEFTDALLTFVPISITWSTASFSVTMEICFLETTFPFIFLTDSIFNHLICASFLAVMLYLLLFRFKPLVEKSAPYLKHEWIFLTFLMFLFFCLVISFFVIPNSMNSFTFPQASIFLLVIIILLSTFHIIFICLGNIILASHAKQSALQLELITAQMEAQKKIITESRRMKHDLRHHSQTLLTLVQTGAAESLIHYLKDIDSVCPSEIETLWCENDIVNSIFTIYSQKALQQNINCDLRASICQDFPVLPSDLVAIIGNLFENAIHGAQLSEKETKHIKIRVSPKQKKLVIHVENDCLDTIQYDEMPTSQYGIGLYSVTTSLKKYQGELSLYANNGTFKATALLNIPDMKS